MLKVQEIRELIKLVDQSSIEEFVYEYDGSKIKMKKTASGSQVATQAVTSAAVKEQSIIEQAEPAKPVQAEKTESVKSSQPEEVKEDSANLHKITSPMVGTFYKSPSPDADAYVKPGAKVTKDSIVCIVEAMKLFNEIEAEINGEIVEVLAEDGQLVEYGQPLFLVKPE